MKPEIVELRRISLRLVTPFRASYGIEHQRDVLLVRVVTPDGEGWGECAALGEPLYSPEYVQGAHHVIATHLLPRLCARGDLVAADVGPVLAAVKGHPMAKAAIETAILDAELRAAGVSLARYLGATRDRVVAGVSVGITGSVGELVDAVGAYIEAGYRRVKLKIEPGWDVEPVRAVRERFADVLLQVDANGAYALEDAGHLGRLDAFDLLMLEQPLAEAEIRGHALLARLITTPICLDESITSAGAAADAIAAGACAIVNVKPGRVGGYLEARRIHDVCEARGVPVWCGGMLETGIGRAGNIALAALPNFILPGDLSASDRYYETDVTPPFVLDGGRLTVPTGPGLGVDVLRDVLDEVTTSVQEVSMAHG